MKRLSFAFLLALSVVLIILSYGLKEREERHKEESAKIPQQIEYFIFDDFMPRKIKEADLLAESIKADIIKIFDENYPDKEVLRKELLDVMNGRSEHSDALGMLETLLTDVSLNNVKGDAFSNNDPMIMIRNPEIGEYVILLDLSPNCRTEDRVRIMSVEKAQQFAKSLFEKAFYEMTTKGREVTFWSFLEPKEKSYPWFEEVRLFTSTDFEGLRSYFRRYGYKIDSLASFEILVNKRINDTVDYFGTRSANHNGSYTNEDMTIVITAGFNIKDQLELSAKYYNKLKSLEDELAEELKDYVMDKFLYHVFMAITIIIFIMSI